MHTHARGWWWWWHHHHARDLSFVIFVKRMRWWALALACLVSAASFTSVSVVISKGHAKNIGGHADAAALRASQYYSRDSPSYRVVRPASSADPNQQQLHEPARLPNTRELITHTINRAGRSFHPATPAVQIQDNTSQQVKSRWKPLSSFAELRKISEQLVAFEKHQKDDINKLREAIEQSTRHAPLYTRQRRDIDLSIQIQYANNRCEAARRRAAQTHEPRVAFVMTTSLDGLDLAKDLIPQLIYHAEVGVGDTFIFYDAPKTPRYQSARDLLQSLHSCVHFVDTAFEDRRGKNEGRWVPMESYEWRRQRLWNHPDLQWFRTDEYGVRWERVVGRAPHSPTGWISNMTMSAFAVAYHSPQPRYGSFRVMIKLCFNAQEAIAMAIERNISLIALHDNDELYYPSWPGGLGGVTSPLSRWNVQQSIARVKMFLRASEGSAPLGGREPPLAADVLPMGWSSERRGTFSIPRALQDALVKQPNGRFIRQIQILNHQHKVLWANGYEKRFEESNLFVRGVHFRPKCKTTDTVTHLCKCDNYAKCNMWLPNHLGMNLYWNGKPFGVVAADLQILGIHSFTVSDPSGVPWRVRYLQAHEVYMHPDVALLHYPYANVAEVSSRAHRFGCETGLDPESPRLPYENVASCFTFPIDFTSYATARMNATGVPDFFRNSIAVPPWKAHDLFQRGYYLTIPEPAAIIKVAHARMRAHARNQN